MGITCLISMFICNTATCAMMCPILAVRLLVMMELNSFHQVVLEQVYRKEKSKEGEVEKVEEENRKAVSCEQNLGQTRQVVSLN